MALLTRSHHFPYNYSNYKSNYYTPSTPVRVDGYIAFHESVVSIQSKDFIHLIICNYRNQYGGLTGYTRSSHKQAGK